jgi:integrase/recombinase XerC
MDNLELYLPRYEDYLRFKQRTDRTISAYHNDLIFLKSLFPPKSIQSITREDVKDVIHSLGLRDGRGSMYDAPTSRVDGDIPKPKYSASTLARKIQCLRSFYKYLRREGIISYDFSDELETPKLPDRREGTYPALTRLQIQHIIDFHQDDCNTKINNARNKIELEKRSSTPNEKRITFYTNEIQRLEDFRDDGLAIILFLYITSCRIGELIKVRAKDLESYIDEGKLFWRVSLFGKGRLKRDATVDPDTGAMIQLRLKRWNIDPRSDAYIFRTTTGAPHHNSASIERMFRKIRDATGIDFLTPHKMRGSSATHLSENGMPIEQIQDLLGHKNATTTRYYVQTNRLQRERSIMRNHPIMNGEINLRRDEQSNESM